MEVKYSLSEGEVENLKYALDKVKYLEDYVEEVRNENPSYQLSEIVRYVGMIKDILSDVLG